MFHYRSLLAAMIGLSFFTAFAVAYTPYGSLVLVFWSCLIVLVTIPTLLGALLNPASKVRTLINTDTNSRDADAWLVLYLLSLFTVAGTAALTSRAMAMQAFLVVLIDMVTRVAITGRRAIDG